MFTALTPGRLVAEQFRLGTVAGDADDRILHDAASGKVYYDADGTGVAAPILVAKLTPGLAIGAEDFFVS